MSKWKKMISGIPQGSVIGPILFIIFINDMWELSICKLFADDCKLYYRLNPVCENKLQIDLTNENQKPKPKKANQILGIIKEIL